MRNETFASRRQLTIATMVLLAGLSMLLIPGVPAQVASVPETAWNATITAWQWLGWTVSTAWNWLF